MNLTEATIKALQGKLNEGVVYAQNNLFKLENVNNTEVLVEYRKAYEEKTDLKYIRITRGKNHKCTLIYEDGNTYSFSWGTSGCTLISDSLNQFKWQVVAFIEHECHILLDIDTMDVPNGLLIFYNYHFNAWQLQFEYRNKNANYWCDKNVNNWEEAAKVAGEFFDIFKNCQYQNTKAETGIDIWVAQI